MGGIGIFFLIMMEVLEAEGVASASDSWRGG